MKIKFNFGYFDKLFELTKSTPLNFYKFMQLGIREVGFPCHFGGYMDKYYIEDAGGSYSTASACGKLWEIIPKKDVNQFERNCLGKFIKSIISLPLLIEVTIDHNKIMTNSRVYYEYRTYPDLREQLDEKFIEHYKLTRKDIAE